MSLHAHNSVIHGVFPNLMRGTSFVLSWKEGDSQCDHMQTMLVAARVQRALDSAGYPLERPMAC